MFLNTFVMGLNSLPKGIFKVSIALKLCTLYFPSIPCLRIYLTKTNMLQRYSGMRILSKVRQIMSQITKGSSSAATKTESCGLCTLDEAAFP